MSVDHAGVLTDLVAGRWRHPESGKTTSVPFKSIVIRDRLDGTEPSLLAAISDFAAEEARGRQ